MTVARLEGTKDISSILDKLEDLDYEASAQSNKIVFVYRKHTNSTDLKRDIKAAKDACKFVGTIKCTHGASSLTC